MSVESILLAVAHVATYQQNQPLTNATGFYFQRGEQLFLITNRHVVCDEANDHVPSRLTITLHSNPDNLAEFTDFSIPLYDDKKQRIWREVQDATSLVDVVAIPLEAHNFPKHTLYKAFTDEHLASDLEEIEVGCSVRVVGYPLNFQDTLHNLPVMRHAIIASSFSLRFKGYGYFLTDSLLHRGSSGSPIVLRVDKRMSGREHFPWLLLGIHSARLGANRDVNEDERLNLFASWYADVLLKLTE